MCESWCGDLVIEIDVFLCSDVNVSEFVGVSVGVCVCVYIYERE